MKHGLDATRSAQTRIGAGEAAVDDGLEWETVM